MKIKHLRKLLYDELTYIYEFNGFYLNSNSMVFELKEWTVFWGTASKHSSSLTFRPRFSISNKDFFSLVNIIFPGDRHYQSATMISKVQGKTFARSMSSLKWDDFLSYSLSSREDIDRILEDHQFFLTEVGLPFFDLTSSIQGIDTFLNKKMLDLNIAEFKEWEEQDKRDFMNNIGFTGVVAGLIAAYLNSKNNLDFLIDKYREFYKDYPFVLGYLEKTVKGLNDIDKSV